MCLPDSRQTASSPGKPHSSKECRSECVALHSSRTENEAQGTVSPFVSPHSLTNKAQTQRETAHYLPRAVFAEQRANRPNLFPAVSDQ